MDFIACIGTEKVSDALFIWMEWNDLLRLRRTCKAVKIVADKFMRTSGISCNSEVEINEKDKTLYKFQSLDFPIPKIYLNNAISGPDFFEKNDFSLFMHKFGENITHLRVYQLSRFLVRNEWTFLDKGLKDLTHLEIDRIIDDKKRLPRTLLRRIFKKKRILSTQSDAIMFFPVGMNNLKYVKIGCEDDSKEVNLTYFAIFTCTIVRACKSLEHICIPSSLVQFMPMKTSEMEKDAYNYDYFGDVIDCIIERMTKKPLFSPIKYLEFGPNFCTTDNYDLKYLEVTKSKILAVKNFVKLAQLSLKYSISLGNVNSAFFTKFANCIDTYNQVGELVHSLVNIRANMLEVKMKNLKTLIIDRSSQSNISPNWAIRPEWPNLKRLHVNGDYPSLFPIWRCDFATNFTDESIYLIFANHFYKFLFGDIVRPSLEELSFNVRPFLGNDGEMTDFSDHTEFPLPEPMDIVSSCPNLKNLTITNWLGGNQTLISLWEGLLGLEVVCLDSCVNAGTVTFVGGNSKDPVFLKLKRLKKLTLRGLDKMPKITDLAFKLVFRHLKLKEFYMESKQPLKFITNSGLSSLLTGNFAISIQRFPFDGFELDESVSPYEEMKEIEDQFRSTHMM